jgi:hypothetical protein
LKIVKSRLKPNRVRERCGMENRKTIHVTSNNALGGRFQIIPGLFYVICLFGALDGYGQSAPSSEIASPTRFVSTNMATASNSAFRAAEGELLVTLGEPPQNLTPFAWHSSAPGIIACGTEVKKCRFDLTYRQVAAGEAASACKVGILDVTVTNQGTVKTPVVVWISWRHAYSNPQIPVGFDLGGEKDYSIEPIVDDKKWNPTSIWYFLEGGFIRDTDIIYWVSLDNGWEKKTWARLPENPYRDLSDMSSLGYTRFQRDLEPKGATSIQVLVPYRPLPLAQRNSLGALLIPHGG